MPHTNWWNPAGSATPLETRPEPTKTGFEERDPKKDNPFRVGTPEYKEHEFMRGWREDEDERDKAYDDPPMRPEFGVVW